MDDFIQKNYIICTGLPKTQASYKPKMMMIPPPLSIVKGKYA